MQTATLTTPCDKNVTAACKKFDRENRIIEESLTELFRQYPHNTDPHHVLLKVIAVNALYSTRIPVYSGKILNALDMAHHIHQHGPEFDSALASGSPEIVDQIANLRVAEKGERCYFSFASKYCSWHKPQSYPIWDSNVHAYLRCLQRQTGFAKGFDVDGYWKYPAFHAVMSDFRKRYRLDSFTFKQIDKFLWAYGADL